MSDPEDPEGPEPTPAPGSEPDDAGAETRYEGPPGGLPRDIGGAPERIGHYRIERRLGRGGMGEVFLAWDEHLARRVAIKCIRHDARLPPEARERFVREARCTASPSHPAIVQPGGGG